MPTFESSVKPISVIRRIAIIVGIVYLALSCFIFRGVIASIPSVLSGEAVISADELVPFFNPDSQLLDQAAGNFNELTNGYEFRVRYALLTTWMRYYKILPFAIVLVNPLVAYAAYLVIAAFLSKVLPKYRAEKIYIISSAPVLVIFLILMYSKIAHFYTLILGFSLFLIAIILMTDGLLVPQKQPYRPIIIACLVILFNPAVHYLVLFALYMSLTVLILVSLDLWQIIRSGAWRSVLHLKTWRKSWQEMRHNWRRILAESRFWRCIGAFVMLAVFTLAPYGAFVKFFALKGVANLSETVPADYYFILDASVPLDHLLSLDMAGIMDKFTTGNYLASTPRWSNMIYTFLLFVPLGIRRARKEILSTPVLKTFSIIIYANALFSMWATLGYVDPAWMPTFHRTIAFIGKFAFGTQTLLGDLIVQLLGTVVQVLRFPHRFEFILFAAACILIPLPLIWMEKHVTIWIQHKVREKNDESDIVSQNLAAIPASLGWRGKVGKLFAPKSNLLAIIIAVAAMFPLFSNASYFNTFVSGNFQNFLAPYPVEPLQQLKQALLKLPQGKVIVLPPTETAKDIVDSNGIDHKFIDKFYIYYLDLPSYYYGLTGDSNNKHEFFLFLRALYYQQGWWVNIARDIEIRYIVVNKGVNANSVGGQEYLRSVEHIIIPEMEKQSAYVRWVFENENYALYEFTDLPRAERVPLFVDTTWYSFIQILANDLTLTRYYDLRYPMMLGDLENYDRLALVTEDEPSAALDLKIKNDPAVFFRPGSTIMPFDSDLISSSYYLSPMFRLFQFFSDSKWNRLNMLTPGLWGTINGGFIGIPRPTQFRIDVIIPEDGEYTLLLRGAATSNDLVINSKLLTEPIHITLRSDSAHMAYFDKAYVFSTNRQAADLSAYSTGEYERLVPDAVVAINSKYQYFPLGTTTAKKGKYTLYFDKKDNAPFVLEGIAVIKSEEYQNMALPENVQRIQMDQLCCGHLIQDLIYP